MILWLLVVVVVFVVLWLRRYRNQSVLVVLGSGGHTAEMLRILRNQPPLNRPLCFIAARNDQLSVIKLKQLYPKATLYTIMRPRAVGQSYLTSLFTTTLAMIEATTMLLRLRPACILANGPAISVAVCYVGKILLGSQIIFIESWARVKSLSLSGKLLRPLADSFLVQWPTLPGDYHGPLV